MAMRTLSLPWTTIVVNSETGTFFPCTPWIDAMSAKKARFTFECVEILGDPKVKPAYQHANVEDEPDAYETLGAARISTGVQYPTAMEALVDPEGAQFTRFGFEGSNDSGSDLSVMRVGGKVEFSD